MEYTVRSIPKFDVNWNVTKNPLQAYTSLEPIPKCDANSATKNTSNQKEEPTCQPFFVGKLFSSGSEDQETKDNRTC